MANFLIGFHDGEKIPEAAKEIEGISVRSAIVNGIRYTCLRIPPVVPMEVSGTHYTIGKGVIIDKSLIADTDLR